MARSKSISPLLLLGTGLLLLGTAVYFIVTDLNQHTPYDIDMSDEEESEYS